VPEIELIEIHMASAHFPIALLMSNVFFDAAGRWRGWMEWRRTSYWCHILGAVSAGVTILLGLIGNPFMEDTGPLGAFWRDHGHAMTQKSVVHSWVGITATVLFLALAVWRFRRKDEFSKTGLAIYGLASALGVALIGLAGYLGAHVMD
jgi:uncharacterized membrane protein